MMCTKVIFNDTTTKCVQDFCTLLFDKFVLNVCTCNFSPVGVDLFSVLFYSNLKISTFGAQLPAGTLGTEGGGNVAGTAPNALITG